MLQYRQALTAYMSVPSDRDHDEKAACGCFAVRPAHGRKVGNRPDEPHTHRDEHDHSEEPPPANERGGDAGTDVDERRPRRKDRTHQEPDRDRNLKTGMFFREEDAGRANSVEPEEPTGGHERQREEQDARVGAPVRRLTRRVAEAECDRAHDPEDHEVERIVLDMRIEP